MFAAICGSAAKDALKVALHPHHLQLTAACWL